MLRAFRPEASRVHYYTLLLYARSKPIFPLEQGL